MGTALALALSILYTLQIDYHTGHKVSYKELLEETVSAAVGLQSMGLNRGDVVGICSENRPEFVTAVMGAICCGAVVTVLNPQYNAGYNKVNLKNSIFSLRLETNF